jgi:ketosteroid isomerase-like protein
VVLRQQPAGVDGPHAGDARRRATELAGIGLGRDRARRGAGGAGLAATASGPGRTVGPGARARRTDVVRRYYSAFDERDLPALLDVVDPGIVFEPVLGILFSRHVYRGHEGIARWYEELDTEWESFEIQVGDTVEAGDGVIAFLRLVAHRGEESLDAQIAVECHFRGERISSIVGREAWDAADQLGVAHHPV